MGLFISKPRIRQDFYLTHRQCWTRAWGRKPASEEQLNWCSLWVAHFQEDRWIWVLHSQFFPNFQAGKSLHLPRWREARRAFKQFFLWWQNWPLILPSSLQVWLQRSHRLWRPASRGTSESSALTVVAERHTWGLGELGQGGQPWESGYFWRRALLKDEAV